MFKKISLLFSLLLLLPLVGCSDKTTIHLANNDNYNVEVSFHDYTVDDYLNDSGINKFDYLSAFEGFYLDEDCTKRYNFENNVPSDLYVKGIYTTPNLLCLVTFIYEDNTYTLYCQKGEKLNQNDFIDRTYGKDIDHTLTFKLGDDVIDFINYEINNDITINVI